MEEVVARIYFNPVLPLYRNHPIDFSMNQLEWDSGCLVKVNVILQIHNLFFISNSIFDLSLSCLEKHYDLSLKIYKNLLSLIFKFSLLSAQCSPLSEFFIDFMTSFVDVVLLVKSCYLLQHKILYRFIKSPFINFSNFQSGQLLSSCLSFDLNFSFSRQQLQSVTKYSRLILINL